MLLQLKNIEKFYGETKVLDQVSLSLHKNEVVGFLGPNGAGKSTTMKIICGYLSATSGEIRINDISLNRISKKSKKQIGYLPENNPLYPDLYVKEYLSFISKIQGLTPKESKEKIKQLSEQIEIQEYLNKKIQTLSKGYRQRVGLVAALLGNPNILILDEPSAGLDPNQSMSLRKIIRELAKDKAILISSHILSEVEAICDKYVFIHKGRIKAEETLASLKDKKISLEKIFQQLTAK